MDFKESCKVLHTFILQLQARLCYLGKYIILGGFEMNYRKSIGYIPITNVFSLTVYSIDTSGVDDYIYVGAEGQRTKKLKIYYAMKRGAYFNFNGARHYLDEIIRI